MKWTGWWHSGWMRNWHGRRLAGRKNAYDAFILTARSLDNLWKALKPQISRLAPEQKIGAENLLLQKLMEVKEELIHACENCQP